MRRKHAAREVGLALGLGFGLVWGAALAAPRAGAQASSTEHRYEGPRLAFVIPAGAQVRETSDVVADYAVEVSLPSEKGQKSIPLRVLLSNNKVADSEVESAANAWRDARLRNRASWGVPKRGEARAELTHIGAHRFVRFVDQMGSVLGATRQIMVCGSMSTRMVCVVASGVSAGDRATEAALMRALETMAVNKRP